MIVIPKYIECKFVSSAPMTHGEFYANTAYPIEFRRGKPSAPGYMITYPDMHMEWIPKEAFESSHFPIEQEDENIPPKIQESDVDKFIKSYEIYKVGDKTTVAVATLINGFIITESSSCVSPDNYDEELGASICKRKIRDKVWFLLGFLLQSSLKGFNESVYNDMGRGR